MQPSVLILHIYTPNFKTQPLNSYEKKLENNYNPKTQPQGAVS